MVDAVFFFFFVFVCVFFFVVAIFPFCSFLSSRFRFCGTIATATGSTLWLVPLLLRCSRKMSQNVSATMRHSKSAPPRFAFTGRKSGRFAPLCVAASASCEEVTAS
jgi:hypothetical protein